MARSPGTLATSTTAPTTVPTITESDVMTSVIGVLEVGSCASVNAACPSARAIETTASVTGTTTVFVIGSGLLVAVGRPTRSPPMQPCA